MVPLASVAHSCADENNDIEHKKRQKKKESITKYSYNDMHSEALFKILENDRTQLNSVTIGEE
jgi:hypothetical protein